MLNIQFKSFNELSNEEIYELFKIRSEVFVVEQNCIYNDFDNKDLEAIHLLVKEDKKIIAYLRILKKDVSFPDPSIGRVLVIKEKRGNGIARLILNKGIEFVFSQFSENAITISAQKYLKNFYCSLGFVPISGVYLEDGIPHLDMSLKEIINS